MTRTIQSQSLRRLGLLVAIAAAYFVGGRVGLRLAVVNPSATAVWPPTGIALAALLLAGYDVWPAIMVGAFLVNLTTTGAVPSAVAIAAGNTLEGLLGAYLVNRFARGRRVGERARDVFTLALLAGMVSTAVGATAGAIAISLDGLARWSDFGSIWPTWWLRGARGGKGGGPPAAVLGPRPGATGAPPPPCCSGRCAPGCTGRDARRSRPPRCSWASWSSGPPYSTG